jgi:signal transduction histidine kinase
VKPALLRDYLSGTVARRDLEAEYVLFCRHKGIYDQVRYLDASGQERVRVNDNQGHPGAVAEDDLQAKAGRYYFARAMLLAEGQVFLSPFDLNIEHDQVEQPPKPVIRFATPVFDRQGVKRGVLVLNYLGSVLLRKLAEVSSSFPGNALLLNDQGFFLRGPRPEDEWGFMLGHDRALASYHPDDWPRIAGQQRGQFLSAAGLFTFRALGGAASAATQEETNDCRLVVVSQVPHAVLDARAGLLLRRLLLLDGVVLFLLLILAWYLGHAGALRRHHEQQLAQSESRLRLLSTRLLNAQEEERRGLSRDLHDELGQVGTAVTLALQRAAQAAPARKDELIGQALHAAEHLLERIHEMAARVRPTMLDDLGLKDAVQNLLSEYERRTGLVARAELRFEPPDVPAVVGENVYRILQEALTNVARHAQAAEVFVELRVTADRVELGVRDRGSGFDPDAADGKRLGLLGMRERAELLGGTFQVRSAPGQGTEVHVVLPLGAARP